MKNINRFIILLIGTFLFVACEEEVDLGNRLNLKPKLVLYGRISPQLDTIVINLTNTSPNFGQQHDYPIQVVMNATVEMSTDEQHWIRLKYDENMASYIIRQAELPVKEGNTYYIRAAADGFETVYSSCMVPYKRELNLSVNMEYALIDTTVISLFDEVPLLIEENYQFMTQIAIHLQDYPNEKNYYYMYGLNHVSSERGRNFSFSDEKADGEYLTIAYVYSQKIQELSDIWNIFPNGIIHENIYIFQLDNNLYLWEHEDDDDWDMPFLMEPSRPYTNIQNGYGVFGAFTITPFSFDLPIVLSNGR